MSSTRLEHASPPASSAEARHRMQVTRQRDTTCELALRSAAHRLGLRFRVDWPLPNTRRRADLAFVSARVAVFVDGCFWHGCPSHGTWPKANAEWWRAKIEGNVRRDRDTDARLSAAGWRVLRFWEHEDMPRAARTLERAVRSRQTRAVRNVRTASPPR
jgi:DNA mismatch endonuclease (patch repair protein)